MKPYAAASAGYIAATAWALCFSNPAWAGLEQERALIQRDPAAALTRLQEQLAHKPSDPYLIYNTAVAAYAAKYQLTYTISPDSTGEIFRTYRLYGLPTQFFIGPEGAIRAIVPSPLNERAAIARIEAILPPIASPAGASPAASSLP